MPTRLPSVARAVAPMVNSTSEGCSGAALGAWGDGVAGAGVGRLRRRRRRRAHPDSSTAHRMAHAPAPPRTPNGRGAGTVALMPPIESRLWLSGSPCSRVHHERIRLSVTVLGEGAIDGNLHQRARLGGNQRDGRSTESTARHPGAQRTVRAGGLHRKVELGGGDLEVVLIDRCDPSRNLPISLGPSSRRVRTVSSTRWFSVTTCRTRRNVTGSSTAAPAADPRCPHRAGSPPRAPRAPLAGLAPLAYPLVACSCG